MDSVIEKENESMCECNFNSDVNNMSQSERDVFYMKRALELAEYALSLGEVPVGAVAVWEDDEKRGIVSEIVGEGYNRRESGKNALYHAEMDAINSACKRLGGWRLHKCTLYVTLEPCAMCAGAIVGARVKRVVFGAPDDRFGAFGGKFNLCEMGINHTPQIDGGVCSERASLLMKEFFDTLRDKHK